MLKSYLDNAATTMLHPDVLQVMTTSLRNHFANPSSLYDLGIENEKRVNFVRQTIADAIHALPEEITFTSGGTEGDNTIIKGVIENQREAVIKKARIITTSIEHPAVKDVFKDFENRGMDVVWLSVDSAGYVDLMQLRDAMTPETILVSIIGVHNEIGTVQNLYEIGKIVHSVNPDCVFHSDYVQGFMKVPLDVKKCEMDALTVCAHKINGPKGVGAIYLKKDLRIRPLLLGGGQEKGLRSGTENIPGILGFGQAVRIMASEGETLRQRISHYRDIMTEALSKLEDIKINGDSNGSPFVLSLSVSGLRGEVLLHSLEARGVYVSTGSACSTHKKEKQSVLKAIGLDPVFAEGTIRISFSALTTEEEVREGAAILVEEIEKLRKWLKVKRKNRK